MGTLLSTIISTDAEKRLASLLQVNANTSCKEFIARAEAYKAKTLENKEILSNYQLEQIIKTFTALNSLITKAKESEETYTKTRNTLLAKLEQLCK